jgi:hypothetical protein
MRGSRPYRIVQAGLTLGVTLPLVVVACAGDEEARPVRDGAGGAGGEGGETGAADGGTAGVVSAGGSGGAEQPGSGGSIGAGATGGVASEGGRGGEPAEADGGAGGAGGSPEVVALCGDGILVPGEVCFGMPLVDTFGESGSVSDVAVADWDGLDGGDAIAVTTGGGVFFRGSDGEGGLLEQATILDAAGGAVPGTRVVAGRFGSESATAPVDVLVGSSSTYTVLFGDGAGDTDASGTFSGAEGQVENLFVADVPGSAESGDLFIIEGTLGTIVTAGSHTGGADFVADTQFDSAGSTVVDVVAGQFDSGPFLRAWSDAEGLWRESVEYDVGGGLDLGADAELTFSEALLGELDVADFDGDGFDDVVATLPDSPNLNVFFGDGDEGAFRLITPLESEFFLSVPLADSTQQDVKAGDFDGDGNADIAVTLQAVDSVAIFLGDGDGGFAAPVLVSTGADSDPTRLAVGDINQDGRDDIAVVGAGRNELIVLLSDP